MMTTTETNTYANTMAPTKEEIAKASRTVGRRPVPRLLVRCGGYEDHVVPRYDRRNGYWFVQHRGRTWELRLRHDGGGFVGIDPQPNYRRDTPKHKSAKEASARNAINWGRQFQHNTCGDKEYTAEDMAKAVAYYLAGVDPWEAASAIQEGREAQPKPSTDRPWWQL